MEGHQLSLDRISILPPTVIEAILCLLQIQEAARTSVLSKTWRYKWTKIPQLVFCDHMFKVSPPYENTDSDDDSDDDLEDLIFQCELKHMSNRFKLFYAIYQALLAHEGPIVDFTLSVCADETCVEIDHIIAHLARTNTLEILLLELGRGYKLPSSFFSLHQLTDLHLRRCDIHHQPTFIGFGRLTRLYLEYVNITRNTLLHLLSKCPLLQTCGLFLIEDNIRGNDNSTIIELLESLPAIETLHILDTVIERFAQGVFPRELPIPLNHLKCFSLEEMSYNDNNCLPFLILLLRSSPNLEKLDLRNLPEVSDYESEDEMLFFTPPDYSSIWLENLKELVIDNFLNVKHEVEFVKLILAKSPLLMKVRIVLVNEVAENEDMQTLNTLLCSAPHASPLVEISVQNGL